jgi:hypothetical protein
MMCLRKRLPGRSIPVQRRPGPTRTLHAQGLLGASDLPARFDCWPATGMPGEPFVIGGRALATKAELKLASLLKRPIGRNPILPAHEDPGDRG